MGEKTKQKSKAKGYCFRLVYPFLIILPATCSGLRELKLTDKRDYRSTCTLIYSPKKWHHYFREFLVLFLPVTPGFIKLPLQPGHAF
jgi:hypothetical protein